MLGGSIGSECSIRSVHSVARYKLGTLGTLHMLQTLRVTGKLGTLGTSSFFGGRKEARLSILYYFILFAPSLLGS